MLRLAFLVLRACLLHTPEGDEGIEPNPFLLECPPMLVDVHAMLEYKGVWKQDFSRVVHLVLGVLTLSLG